jgi:K+-sensing histidine kinase KdpD
MEHDIKGRLNNDNLKIHHKSLNFDAVHSPMLVSQIILNIVKNSVDHNSHMLDDLVVNIYGNNKDIIYIEDNGKGIPPSIISNIFNPGISTKSDISTPSGIGLASTVDYCMIMNAIIRVESKVNRFTRFHIQFSSEISGTINVKENDIWYRNKYFQVINTPETDSIYKKQKSGVNISVLPIKDTALEKRINDIDENFKKLN